MGQANSPAKEPSLLRFLFSSGIIYIHFAHAYAVLFLVRELWLFRLFFSLFQVLLACYMKMNLAIFMYDLGSEAKLARLVFTLKDLRLENIQIVFYIMHTFS